jgi:hypothetical protein
MRVRVGDGPAVALPLWDVSQTHEHLVRRHTGHAIYQAFSSWLAERGVRVSPLAAEAVARHAVDRVEQLRRGPGFTEAVLSGFYGFNCFDLPDHVKLALEANRPVLEARAALKDDVPDNRVYALVLTATGSEELASDALSARIADRLRRKQPVDL